MDDKQVMDSAAEEMKETAAETTEAMEPAEAADAVAAEPVEQTIVAVLTAMVKENDGVFPDDTDKAALRFSEIGGDLVRESRLFDVFLACGGSEDLLAVKEAAEADQRKAVSAVTNQMHTEYWIDSVAGETICRDFLTAIGVEASEREETLCQLADRYYNGNGVAQDKEKAAELYEEAGSDGDAIAQYTLGYMYDKGDGVDKDRAKAMIWYEKAADQGHESAQNRLGVLRRLQEKAAPQPVKPVVEADDKPKKKRFFGK